jgi:lipoprotein-anchoring transpeptidase ErfK/SrfK
MVDVIRTAFLHGRCVVSAISRARVCRAIAVLAIVTVSTGPAFAQALSFAPAFRFDQPLSQYAPQQQDEEAGTEQLPAQFRRQMVTYPSNEPSGTIIIDSGHTFLYLTLGHGMAMRYGIGVGRQGFTWSGVGKHVSSGCIRLQNADIIDLYNHVGIGTKVVVLANDPRRASLDDAKPLVMQDAPRGARISAQIPVRPAAEPRELISSRNGPSGLY